MESNWFAIQVRSRHEKSISRILGSKGFEQFLPAYRSKTQMDRPGKGTRCSPFSRIRVLLISARCPNSVSDHAAVPISEQNMRGNGIFDPQEPPQRRHFDDYQELPGASNESQ